MTTMKTDPRTGSRLEAEILDALGTVLDPELDEPITDLGFVRSVAIDDSGVEVHLRLPTSFCSPNFAYLMVSDAQDALEPIPDIGSVLVQLDDHHDSDKINSGIAAGAGYRGTFGVEAEDSLEELRQTFRRKAHTAAMERCCRALLTGGGWQIDQLPLAELQDLPAGAQKSALLRRREAIGLPNDRQARVMVDHRGISVGRSDAALQLRLATATRVSIEGNAHFCRGLLATRYNDSDPGMAAGGAAVITNTRRNR